MRKKYSAFRHADYDQVAFLEHPLSKFGLAYLIEHESENFIVLFNADNNSDLEFPLPYGTWEVLVDKNSAGLIPVSIVERTLKVESSTGTVLRKIN